MKHHSISLVAGMCVSAWTGVAVAADSATAELEAVEVSATRLRSVPDLDVPASVTTVLVDADSNRNQTNVTEVLAGLPGVTALDRQNYAQDTQLSIRGFGARATFGVRGLRLYSDGIPASTPDGQGQLSNFNVLGAYTMQVLRGPFSALYGNSSGGVVQLWSTPGTEEPSARVRATYGSFGTQSYGLQALGSGGIFDYNLALSRFETDGNRDHSAARRDLANLRLGIDVGADRSLVLIGNYVDLPEAQDPLGITPTAWWTDPQQTAAVATQFNTRKSVEQLQGGAIFEQRFGNNALRAVVYNGNRKVVQYLSISPTTQNNVNHSGGVVDLDTDYRGTDLRWSWTGELAGRPLEFTLGTTYDWQDQLRRGYNNYTGPANSNCDAGTVCGVRGVLRRDEDNRVTGLDQYAQGWWQFTDRWSALVGLRHSKVKIRSEDNYTVNNGDDSGSASYGDTTVVGGVMFKPVESLRLYASTGDGFQTPTFNEIAYRADQQAGLATDLVAESSHNYELGVKWRPSNGAEVDAALYRADTRHELTVARNGGGRASYQNVPKSLRQGLELWGRAPLVQDLALEGSYTFIDAEFTRSYETCPGIPCNPATQSVTVPSGTRIPGVPRHQGRLRLSWTPRAWTVAAEIAASSKIMVTDASNWAITNTASLTDHAPGYGVWNVDAGYDWQFADSQLRGFVRIENLTDRNYVGSVIVNESNSRYFETGAERSVMAGVQWTWR